MSPSLTVNLLQSPPPSAIIPSVHFHSSPLFISTHHTSPSPSFNLKWELGANGSSRLRASRAQGHAFIVLPKGNGFSAKGSNKEVIMVDPLEAKRIAAREMEEIQAKEKFERKRQAEAINGALAMIGLTAGLIIEGQTGRGILVQLHGYVDSIISFILSHLS